MPTKRKGATPKSAKPSHVLSSENGNSRSRRTNPIPLGTYISVTGVHTTLWAFTMLFLPRTSFLSPLTAPEWDAAQLSSRDKPQHPFLEPLTRNPTSTLLWMCFGAVILQTWWASWLRKWWLDIGLRGSDSEKRIERKHYDEKIFMTFFNACLATLAASGPVHVLLVLFGANISSYILKTYLLALLLSIMVIYPPCFVIGVPTISNDSAAIFRKWTWLRLYVEFSSRNLVERALVHSAIGAALGSWVGTLPIALDWDRPWQAWPLTPAFGAVVGYILASVFCVTVSSFHQVLEDHVDARIKAE